MRTAINPLSHRSFMAVKKTESWHRDGPAQTNLFHWSPTHIYLLTVCHPWKPKTFPSYCHSTNSCGSAHINFSDSGDTTSMLSGANPQRYLCNPSLRNTAIEAPLYTSCSVNAESTMVWQPSLSFNLRCEVFTRVQTYPADVFWDPWAPLHLLWHCRPARHATQRVSCLRAAVWGCPACWWPHGSPISFSLHQIFPPLESLL